jgi:hypothetical protein
VPDLAAYHARDLFRAARFLGALRRVERVARAARSVAPGGDDRARGGDDARPRHEPASIARLSWTSPSNAPSVPRSRVVVMPASSVARACATAATMR